MSNSTRDTNLVDSGFCPQCGNKMPCAKHLHGDSEIKVWKPVTYEGCSPSLPKGGAVVNLEQKLAAHTLVLDTGAHTKFLDQYKGRDLTPVVVDEIYKATIKDGVIDHHSVDMFLAAQGIHVEKCATQMVADYPGEVLAMTEENQIINVETHFDGDIDSVCSSYLTKSLMENGRLPDIGPALAAFANKIDYGRSQEIHPDFMKPEFFVNTLLGLFESIKLQCKKRAGQEIREKGFSPAILAKHEKMIGESMFELLNVANVMAVELNISGDVSALIEKVGTQTRELIDAGRPLIEESYRQFTEDFEQAQRMQAVVKDREGNDVEANLIISQSKDPLMFTNLSYARTSPNTIVAVFAGSDRKSGDMYDIGITPDQAKVFDLRSVCLALNKAEREKRDAVYAKPASERTEGEQKMVEDWDAQRAEGKFRDAFANLKEMIARGEVDVANVLDVDPTPLVAGDSLIPASRTSLLSFKEFDEVLKRFVK
ncbi:MAG TPA: hypothetical protein VJH75_02150 [Patescibacteria group bacterium]|nr:hypothetical protein [Patescibacteria group bacterium]